LRWWPAGLRANARRCTNGATQWGRKRAARQKD
jgi:hypothetical protein